MNLALLLLLPLSLTLGTVAAAAAASPRCRCLPTEPCWPSASDWAVLNGTLDGNMAALEPVAKVCHEPNVVDPALCGEIALMATNSSWRASEPSTGQWANWESWPLQNESCYIDSAAAIPCGQGRVPLYSAAVRSASHIQAAVRFASTHNIRLVVKNTGHDFAGRSLAPHSLQLFTHHMKDIRYDEHFVPKGTPQGQQQQQHGEPAVTVGAGVQFHQLYNFCAEKNISVVGGFSSTVGAAGGYLQGGGHSILGPWKGLASDHVLQYTVVVADGSHVTANAHQNADLFWALRGGGGGTFGVVTSATLRAHANPPIVAATLDVSRDAADQTFWALVRDLYAHLPALNDLGASGVHVVYPKMPIDMTDPTAGLRAAITIQLLFANQPSAAAVADALAPLEASFRITAASSNTTTTTSNPPGLSFRIVPFPSLSALYAATLTGSDRGGALTAMTSRLVSREFIASPQGPSAIADTFSKLPLGIGEAVSGNVVAGGAVARNGASVSSAVNPAWRRTLSHVSVVRGWSSVNNSAFFADEERVHRELTTSIGDALRALRLDDEPEMGAYMNEGDAYEPDFQQSFWGLENYARLHAIKRTWDPRGLFIVRRGVGSEDWDDDGLCRVR